MRERLQEAKLRCKLPRLSLPKAPTGSSSTADQRVAKEAAAAPAQLLVAVTARDTAADDDGELHDIDRQVADQRATFPEVTHRSHCALLTEAYISIEPYA